MVTFTEISRKHVWSAAADQLRHSIENGTFDAGQKLPSERTLCSQFGISRISLREALRALSQEGYISIQSGRGAYILSSQDRRRKVLDGWMGSDHKSAEKTFELRLLFEPGVAALVARRCTPELLAKLGDTIVAMNRPDGDIGDIIEADSEFHQLLGMNTGNDLVGALVQFTMSATGEERRITLGSWAGVERAIMGHKRILEAIRQADPAAAERAMHDHLQDAIAFSTPPE